MHIPTQGLHTVSDALAAYAAATRLGLDPAKAAAALSNYRTTGMRQNIVHHGGVTFIEDCYNASPDSMRAALDILNRQVPGPDGRRIAVLGDMLELGAASEQAHRQTGEWAAETADILLAVGPNSAAMAEAAGPKSNNIALPKYTGSSRISKVEPAPRRRGAGQGQPRHAV